MNYTSPKIYEKLHFLQSDFKISCIRERTSFLTPAERTLHEEIEIKFFYEGSSTLMIGSEIFNTQPGDIVVINPYECHSTIDVGINKGRYHLINLALDFLVENNPNGLNLRHLLLGKGICFKNLIRGDENLQRILNNVIEEMQKKESSYKLMVRCLMTEFFLHLMRYAIDEEKNNQISDKNIRYYQMIEPALQLIYTSYAQKLTLDQMASACGMSKYHFCRIFQQSKGVTAMQYLNSHRLKIANVLLTNTDKNIAEVAEASGFLDEGYFCRCYKKMYGISPKQNKAKLTIK